MKRVGNRRRQVVNGLIEDASWFDAGDLARLVVENSDPLVDPSRDDTRGQILQERLIIYLRVLDLSEKLRVIDGNGELAAENLQSVLLDGSIDAS